MPSIHWPILKSLAAGLTRIRAQDDQRKWRALELLVASQHIAAEVARVSQTRTVAVMLPSTGSFPASALGVWTLGRVCVPLNFLLRKEELQYVIDDCGTDTIITATPMLEHLGYVPERARLILLDKLNFKSMPEPRWPARATSDDLAVLIYTSGTSGKPKGVMLSHGNITANIDQYRRAVSITADDVMLGVLPAFHSFGFTVLTMAPLTIGCNVVYSARFVPQRIIKLIREHRATIFVAIPSMYNALLGVKDARREDLASLRLAVSGGEPLPLDVAERFYEKFGVRINEGYGLTETAPATNVCLPENHRPHSVGRPLPGVQQRIVEPESGRTLGPNQDGEVRMKGPNIMQGYYKLPAETAAAFDKDGWFRTGDIGRFDSDGHLSITGRIKEMMIVGGENVFPREIEEVLNKHPEVHASAVIGLNDPMRGEVPIAFIEVREGGHFDEPNLRSWCRERLANYKVPRDIRHVEALPRNPTGKIMRRELKKLL
ncbi:MAG: AMP-binding protein [Phycisphaerales bacterium]